MYMRTMISKCMRIPKRNTRYRVMCFPKMYQAEQKSSVIHFVKNGRSIYSSLRLLYLYDNLFISKK